MNIQKLTQKSIEAVQAAQNMSIEYGNQQIEQEHLLLCLINDEEGLIPQLFLKCDVSVQLLRSRLEQAVSALPKVGGVSSDRVSISPRLD